MFRVLGWVYEGSLLTVRSTRKLFRHVSHGPHPLKGVIQGIVGDPYRGYSRDIRSLWRL